MEAIASLTQKGYRVSVATNQSGIARGLLDMSMLNSIHKKMHETVHQAGGKIDAVFLCPHGPDDQCECRKPKTGMLKETFRRFGVSGSEVIGVGDSLRDMQAFAAAGCQPILVKTGKGNITLKNAEQSTELALPADTLIYENLAEASRHILANNKVNA